ncbi:hypothetical protein [Streptomyces ipomoeae]|uniref:hypothetical protein n=1 Tax=Streptomyces ipomoeae TaxID=103232 RepID=UPI0029B97C70|nr:hypothetical protein [Streptomyces ipomoeae]MDX2697151.1 hypothetical protein [Streptomyces ipomoeae]MDX2843061.1 hypothetical protein [Streptomyces ipomoeae]
MALLKRVDWQEKELPYSAAEVARYEARVQRVRAEVAEIRAAVAGMQAAGGAFLKEVAVSPNRQARYLESANEADGVVELQPQDDTVEHPVHGITPTRQALLLARAWTAEHASG